MSEQKEEGTSFLSIIVFALFFLLIYKTSGFYLSLSGGEALQVKEQRYQQMEDRAAGTANLSLILTWLMMAGVGLALHFVNKDRALSTWARAWPFGVLLILIVLSILWSSVPEIALRRVVKHLLFIAAVAGVVVGATSPGQVVRIAVPATGVLMALNCAAVLLFHGSATGPHGEFAGFHGHKNGAGQFAMVSIFIWLAAARWSSGVWLRAGLYGGTLVWFLFLLGTDSRTSIMATVVTILSVIVLRHCIRWPVAGSIFGLSALFLSLCAVFALISYNISFADLIAGIEGERTTFSGRAKVWLIAYNAFLEHKLLGTGFGSLWGIGGLPAVQVYTDLHPTSFLIVLNQAHNGYFDVLAALGLVGAVVFFVFLASFIWTDVRVWVTSDYGKDGSLLFEFSSFIFVAALLSNVAETTFFRADIIWMFFVLCYLTLCSTRSSTDRGSSWEAESVSVVAPSAKALHRPSRRNH